MAKKATVALHGFQKRGIQIDIDATDGATVGQNLYWADGTLITEADFGGGTTVVTTPGGGGVTVSATLWALILDIPAFIQSLAALATNGLVAYVAGVATARTIQGETGRIVVTNGNGVAGNPTIALGSWPTVKNSIATGEVATIPNGHQMLVWDTFTFDGGFLTMDGDLVIV